jgi:DNA replication licensing factor MCM4
MRRLSETVEPSDVDEAVRLVRDAMQTASINPETGAIDMDIINTGRCVQCSACGKVRRNSNFQ